MLGTYEPKNFGKEYVAINGSSQYSMFAATALGVKPCFDDWVDMKKYVQFLSMCSEYGLHVEPDVIFLDKRPKKEDVIGGESITTTYAGVRPFNKNCKEGRVHVFVSKSKKRAKETRKFGWYPGIIRSRITNKPFVDHMRFGKNLGFPKCCIDFFRKYNNWAKYSHPYESYKNTPKGKASYYCNNFPMDYSYFYIHHNPCNYMCKSTIKLAKNVEQKIADVEPKFVEITTNFLKSPMLVFGERNCVFFEGELEDNEIKYKSLNYLSNYARKEETIDFKDKLEQGNKLFFDQDTVVIEKNNSPIFKAKKKPEWFLIDFK